MKPMSTLVPMNRRSQGRLSSRPPSAPEKAPLQGSGLPFAVWEPWRLCFVLLLLAILLCLPHFSRAGTAPAGLPDTSKMNLLFIIMEDCYAGVWGSYGNPICKTPNMDRFARTAVHFDAAYVQAACCNPSRTSFLTGLRPLTARVWGNAQVMSERLPPDTLTLPELLKKKGLYTAVIGKFFHTTEYAGPQLMAFDRIEHYSPPPDWKGPGARLKFPPVKRTVQDPAPKDRNSPEYRAWQKQRSDRYGDSGLAPEEEGDYRISQTAVALRNCAGFSKNNVSLAHTVSMSLCPKTWRRSTPLSRSGIRKGMATPSTTKCCPVNATVSGAPAGPSFSPAVLAPPTTISVAMYTASVATGIALPSPASLASLTS